MRYRIKNVLSVLPLCALLSACTQPLAEEPSTPQPTPTETPVPTSSPTGFPAPLTLAGRELEHALRRDDSERGFSADEAARLDELFGLCGFSADEPFYVYENEDGEADLTLWYEEESGVGIGICGIHGFAFDSTAKAGPGDELSEQMGFGDFRWKGELIPPEPAFLEPVDYREEREYNEAGQVTELNSFGKFEGWGDQWIWVYDIEYTYDESGIARHRSFGRNSMLFSTTNPGSDGYYDDQGRLVYERGYITHGHTETYYIYDGDHTTPSYQLYLDFMPPQYFPSFVRY